MVAFVTTHKVGKANSAASSSPAPAQAAPKARQTPAAKAAPAKRAAPAGRQAGASLGLPVSVARAFAKHQAVLIYFGGSGSDDAMTADSVRAVKASAGRGVAVFMNKLSNLADYRRVVEGLDVSQAPSIVIVDRARKARLIEGFIDAGSLRQDVADVAR
jgi:pyruvate/2-oxoglutarate dehydrogenase complex dihydrolipoamide acyltransferase (E2) component